jgi:hypothetical protein
MKRIIVCFVLATLLFPVPVSGQATKSATAASAPQTQQPPPTITSTVDREISTVEKEILDAAKAMRGDKFNFSPESLNISSSDYRVVRATMEICARAWIIARDASNRGIPRWISFRLRDESGDRPPVQCCECAEQNQCDKRRHVKNYVQRVRPDAVAFGQESVRRAEHRPIANRSLWLGVNQVWNPPGLQLADE